MRTNFKLFCTVLFFAGSIFVWAQQKTITGQVTDSDGFPVADAYVYVEGTDGVYTDEDGNYSLNVKQGDKVLIEFLGLDTKTITVGNKSSYNVSLVDEGAVDVGDILVLGYDNTVTKAESKGASTTIGEDVFEGRPTVSFLSSVQGNSPGVVIQSSSGSPGSAQINALIRGVSSVNSSTEPLIVIDGIVTGANQFRNMNQSDFASVSILRDSHATSIYGNRGANGVIVITTKSGKYNQDLKVGLTTSYGVFTLPSNDYNIANAKQQLTLQNRVGAGLGSTLTQSEIDAWTIDTDWVDHFFREGTNQQYNLTVSQGGENFNVFTSLGYMDVEGMVPTTDFKRFTARINANGKSKSGKLEYGVVLAPGYSKRHQLDSETNGRISANTIQNPLQGSMRGLAYLEPGIYANGQELYDAIGTNFDRGGGIYVLEDILKGTLPNTLNEFNIMSNAFVNYKLTDNLTARTKLSVDYKHQQRMFARAPWSYLAIAVRNINGTDFGGSETIWNDQDLTFSNVNSLHYDATFADVHKLQVGAYLEYIKAHNIYSSRTQNGLDPRTWELGSGTGYIPRDGDNYIPTVSASKINTGSFSYFATLDYDYDSKYGVGFNIRRDATYRFIEDKKWGTFWSAAARWNIDKEGFMEEVDFVNMLKLRASYGTQGNSVIGRVPYDYNAMFIKPDVALEYNTTGGGYLNQNAYFLRLGNRYIQWEVTKQFNVGLDWILFSNKFEGNLDLYNKVTDELFDTAGLSAVVGQSSTDANNGKLSNKGVELNLKYHIFKNRKDFNLSVFANSAYNKNKIEELTVSNSLEPGTTVNQVGGPVSQWYMYNYLGVNRANGNLLFADVNGNPVENPTTDDAVFTGKTIYPTWVGGFGFDADYKGFYTNVQFSYQADVWRFDNQLSWLYDSSASAISGGAVSADLLNAWTPDNVYTDIPLLEATNANFSGQSDRLLKDASFLKLKNVTFGYSFPKEWISKAKVTNLSLYIQAENLAVWSKWRGFDPEGRSASALGVYPLPRTVSLGFNVEF